MSSPVDGKQSVGRPPCEISVADLQELLHEHVGRRVDTSTFAGVDPADVHSRHRNFFKALMQHTRALSKFVVKPALPSSMSVGQKEVVAGQLMAAFSDLLRKDRHGTRASETYEEVLNVTDKKKAWTTKSQLSACSDLVEQSSQEPFQNLVIPASPAKAGDPEEVESSQESMQTLDSFSPDSDEIHEALRDEKTDDEHRKQFLERAGSSPTEVRTSLVEVIAHVSPDTGVASAAASAPKYSSLPSWFNSRALKMQLEWPLGNQVLGDVAVGPRGFLMVTWPDGSIYESEISNLALSVPPEEPKVLKKPAAAVRRRPAAASAHTADVEEAEAEEGAAAAEEDEDDDEDTLPFPGLRDAPVEAEAELEEPEAESETQAEKAEAELEEAEESEFREEAEPVDWLSQQATLAADALAAVPAAALAALGPGREDPLHQVSPVFGALRTYMGPDKAYIQYHAEDGRWLSVANLSKVACSHNHKQHCLAIWYQCSQPGFNLESAERLKLALQSQGPEDVE